MEVKKERYYLGQIEACELLGDNEEAMNLKESYMQHENKKSSVAKQKLKTTKKRRNFKKSLKEIFKDFKKDISLYLADISMEKRK